MLIILFHVYNLEIFNSMISKYNFLHDKNVSYICSCNSLEIKKHIYDSLQNVLAINIIENKGMDIGGNLTNMKTLLNLNIEYDYCLFLHTKSDDIWRNKLLNNILNIQCIQHMESLLDIPFIVGSYDCFRKNKVVNRNSIQEIIEHNHLPNDILWDEYYTSERPLNVNYDFYKFYETDLNQCKDVVSHYEKHGKNEFHRITNPCYIKSIQKPIYFIAGTCFWMNKSYTLLFKKIDIDYHYQQFKEGYIVNDTESTTHAWEYMYSILAYLYNGCVYGYNTKIIDNLNEDKYNEEIYKKCNHDLTTLNSIQLKQHYEKFGKNENRIYSLHTLIKQQSIINIPYLQSTIAFYLFIPSNNECGGYKTLLRYINYLTNNGYSIDIYLGHNSTSQKTIYGYSIIKEHLKDIIKVIESYNVLDISKYNYYLGFNLQRKYHYAVANAWQTAEAVYNNRHLSTHIMYIIQDVEKLFYNKEHLIKNVELTYKPEYKYFCLSNYLSDYFKKYNPFKSYICYNDAYFYDKYKIRKNGVVCVYYKNKIRRIPELMRKIINRLSTHEIDCYVFPNQIEINNKYVHNIGVLNDKQINELYNTYKVGIVLSNSNVSRMGFEMKACGMHVLEYDSIYGKFDLEDKYFKKISNEYIVKLVNELYKKPNELDLEFVDKYHLNNELKHIKSFFDNYLSI